MLHDHSLERDGGGALLDERGQRMRWLQQWGKHSDAGADRVAPL